MYDIVETSQSRCRWAGVQHATGYGGTAAAAAAEMRMEKREERTDADLAAINTDV